MTRFPLALLLISLSFVAPVAGQTSTPVPSDTVNALPIEPVRTLRFTTDEGTLDLVGRVAGWTVHRVRPPGDLYTIPIGGGDATRLTRGTPWDGMPRWSPDGRTIAFISDRDGGDNLWLVSPDGTGLRKLTSEVDNNALLSRHGPPTAPT